MDRMDNLICRVIECAEIRGEVDMAFVLKVAKLKSPQKNLVNKLIDASDQLQDIIDMILSSSGITLDLVQKILRANTEELNLLQKVTELNSKDLDLLRGVICLCGGKKYFICKFMDWFLGDESLDLSCACSGIKGVERVGKDGACDVKNRNDAVVSSCASQQGNSGTSTERLGKSCTENIFPVSETVTFRKNRIVAKEGNIVESCGSSTEDRPEDLVQPTVAVKDLLSYDPVPPGSSALSEKVCGSSLLRTEHNNLGVQLEDATDKRNWSLSVPVACGTSNTQGSVTGSHEQDLPNTKSAQSACGNMDKGEKHTLVLRVDNNYYVKGMKESAQESVTVGVRQASKTCLLPKQNVDTQVHEKQIRNESLQENLLDVRTSALSAVKSTGMELQNDKSNDGCLPGRDGPESRLDVSGKLCCKPSEEFVLKDCYVRLDDVAHVLKGKTTVSSKDLEGVQGIRIEKNIIENGSSNVSDCGVRGCSNMSLNKERKENTRERRYINNAKKRRTLSCEDLDLQVDNENVERPKEIVLNESVTGNEKSTSTDLGFKNVNMTLRNVRRKRTTRLKCYTNRAKKNTQISNGPQDAVVKEKMLVGGHSESGDLRQDKGKTCSEVGVNTANNNNQNLNISNLSTVQFSDSEVMPEVTQVTEGYRHQHKVPEIQAPEFMCNTESSNQSVGNLRKESAVLVGPVAIHEGSASNLVERKYNMRIRVKPEFNERSGMLWRPLFQEGENAGREKENVLGFQLQPYSMERVGSLKWAQFTTCIDHPYSAGRHSHG